MGCCLGGTRTGGGAGGVAAGGRGKLAGSCTAVQDGAAVTILRSGSRDGDRSRSAHAAPALGPRAPWALAACTAAPAIGIDPIPLGSWRAAEAAAICICAAPSATICALPARSEVASKLAGVVWLLVHDAQLCHLSLLKDNRRKEEGVGSRG
eukprot:1158221-Pelagomonas_calceolata.AAC.8